MKQKKSYTYTKQKHPFNFILFFEVQVNLNYLHL